MAQLRIMRRMQHLLFEIALQYVTFLIIFLIFLYNFNILVLKIK